MEDCMINEDRWDCDRHDQFDEDDYVEPDWWDQDLQPWYDPAKYDEVFA